VSPTDHAAELAARVADLLAGRTLAVAESCTAGALAAACAAAGDGATWFRGGIVAYQDEVKRNLLGVAAPSTVTAVAAAEMARGAARLFGVDVAVATTGVFGAEPVDGVPPTTVIVATHVHGAVRVHRHALESDPSIAVDQAVAAALGQLVDHLDDARLCRM
jgi:nicotinamide-nucleotide amidase